jgi:hypothetical protein
MPHSFSLVGNPPLLFIREGGARDELNKEVPTQYYRASFGMFFSCVR